MPPKRELVLREVVREALAAYRANPRLLIAAAFIISIPIGLAEAAAHATPEIEGNEGIEVPLASLAALALSITVTLGDVFFTGVVATVVGEYRTGVRRQLIEIARALRYRQLIAVDLIFALMVGVGLLLLIVPGVVVFGWYVLAAAVVEIEDRGVRDSFRRSRELVRGNFWRVLALLAPTMLVADALGELLQAIGPNLAGEGFWGDFVGATLAETATVPLFALAAVVTTHHLISRNADEASPRTPPR